MKIKILSQEVEIVKITDESWKGLFLNEDDCHENWGVSHYGQNRIVIKDTVQNFRVLMHEIKHFWDDFIGNHQIDSSTREQICDSFGAFTNDLMLENGDDIFKKLKEFAEKR